MAFELPSDIAGLRGTVVTPDPKDMLTKWGWIVFYPIAIAIAYFISTPIMAFGAILLLPSLVNSLLALKVKELKHPDKVQSAEIIAYGKNGIYDVEFVKLLDIKVKDVQNMKWNRSAFADLTTGKKAFNRISLTILLPAIMIAAVALLFFNPNIIETILICGMTIAICLYFGPALGDPPPNVINGKRYFVFFGICEGQMIVFVPNEMEYGIEMQPPPEII